MPPAAVADHNPGTGTSADERPPVHVVTSGINSERRKSIRVTPRPRGGQQVVMSLHPDQIQPLLPGDGIEGKAELEVSTTCKRPLPSCVGRRYRFNPRVSARLVLASGPRIAFGPEAVPISGWHHKRCWQRQRSRNHHCVLVIPEATRIVNHASELPCGSRCHLNLVAKANHPRAKRGHRLVIGAAAPDEIKHDKGQLAAAVFRPWPANELASLLGNDVLMAPTIPVGPNRPEAARRRVVYSQRLDDLRAGEQLVVDARAMVDNAHLRYLTLVQARLILARGPDIKVRAGPPRAVASFNGRVGAQNGFNCTQGPSGHSTPCEVRKTGVMRILRDARERPWRGTGERIPLYLNLVVGTRAVGMHAGRHQATDEVRLREGGFVRVRRHAPELGP